MWHIIQFSAVYYTDFNKIKGEEDYVIADIIVPTIIIRRMNYIRYLENVLKTVDPFNRLQSFQAI